MKYLIASIFILILSFLGVIKPLEDAGGFTMSTLSIPFRRSALQVKEHALFLINIGEIYNENQKLEQKVLEFESQKALIDNLIKENKALKEQFLSGEDDVEHLDSAENPNLVLTSITGNPEDLTNSTAYINAGQNRGVKEGSMVIYRNFMIGQVTKVEKLRSLITFLYSSDLSVPVVRYSALNNSAQAVDSVSPLPAPIENIYTEGIVSGDFGTSLKLERVLQKEPLEKGDILITSGREGQFRSGYIVGKVGDIYAEPTEPLKSAQVLPLIEIEKLSKVFVFTKEDSNGADSQDKEQE